MDTAQANAPTHELASVMLLQTICRMNRTKPRWVAYNVTKGASKVVEVVCNVLLAVSRGTTIATKCKAVFIWLELNDVLKREPTKIEIESQGAILRTQTEFKRNDSEA